MSALGDPAVLARAAPVVAFDPSLPPRLTVEPGARVRVETHDARAGALLDREPGRSFELGRPDPATSNGLTGPIAVRGARPGDRLVVEVEELRLDAIGWCGAHAHVGPLPPGRVDRPLGRTCRIGPEGIEFGDGILLPLAPMIGCLGTAPADGPASSGSIGRHGGNLDQRPVAAGARVHLPVTVDGALLYVGDVHAAQGDGELSGVALECAAEVSLRLELVPRAAPAWPWVEAGDRIMVLTAGPDFATARREAVEAVVGALEQQLGLEAAEAMALVSVAGDLRVGQAFGGGELSLRLELPAALGLVPA
jgi:amidase